MTASHYMSALRWTFDVVSLRDMLLLRARPTYRAILGHVCLRVHSSISASSTEPKTGMSRQLEKKDFGPSGFRKRVWESAERTTRAKSGCDAVAIIAKVRSKSEPLKIILEAQYRPSQDAMVVEMPAGLIDEGEDAAKAAIRELKEETGYSGQITSVSEPCFSDPGMTNSNMQWAVVDIDADSPDNADVKPEQEPGEFIEVFLVPMKGLHKSLVDLKKEQGWELDARLLGYAWGLQHSEEWEISKPGA